MFSDSFFDNSLYIDINAIEKNYLLLKERAHPALCAATVKANAYGLGIERVARCLYDVGCRDFFVATLGEAIALRRIKQDINIYVFHGIKKNEANAFLGNNLIPILNDIEQIKLWDKFAFSRKIILPAILHFDTGINRLGLDINNAQKIAKNLPSNIKITYIMSHFATANEVNNKRNIIQLNDFKKIKDLFPKQKATIANSSAIFLGKEYIHDMVRPGAALFGINPIPYNKKNPIHNVIRLTSKIIQIKKITRDGMVGYGDVCPVKKGTIIATIPLGYADGYHRSLTNRSYCYLDNKFIPTLGKISMDMTILDISQFEEGEIKVGDEVEVIGKNIKLSVLSKQANTIAYEILTSFSERCKKIYIK
jgi:alanine racemase